MQSFFQIQGAISAHGDHDSGASICKLQLAELVEQMSSHLKQYPQFQYK